MSVDNRRYDKPLACDKCGLEPVNRFGGCDCYTMVKQSDGTWKAMWELDRDRAR